MDPSQKKSVLCKQLQDVYTRQELFLWMALNIRERKYVQAIKFAFRQRNQSHIS